MSEEQVLGNDARERVKTVIRDEANKLLKESSTGQVSEVLLGDFLTKSQPRMAGLLCPPDPPSPATIRHINIPTGKPPVIFIGYTEEITIVNPVEH